MSSLASNLPFIATSSKSNSTIKKYSSTFERFDKWCKIYNLKSLPAEVTTVAIYLAFLIQSQASVSVLNGAFYSIKWEHELNLYHDIFSEKFLSIILEGGIRILSKPTIKKEPITADILKSVINKFGSSNNLNHIRICCLMLISYAGFLRYDELAHIKASNIRFFQSHIELLLEKSKTDVYRQGNTVIIARTGGATCPVAILEHYLSMAGIDIKSDEFIFRSISFIKKTDSYCLCKVNKPLSYTRAREILLSTLDSIGLEKQKFGLHSLRSGGVSAAAHNRVPERLLKAHGRWRSEKAKDGYIKENLNNRISVSKKLGI